jgi:hypothetical protein
MSDTLQWGIDETFSAEDMGGSGMESLSPDEFLTPNNIATPNDMDINVPVIDCISMVSQFCQFNQAECFIDRDNIVKPKASAIPLFESNYPDCSGSILNPEDDGSPTTSPNQNNMKEGYLNPKSENFLGGSGMRQAILFFLAVAILLVVTQGKPVKATAKAVKEAL